MLYIGKNSYGKKYRRTTSIKFFISDKDQQSCPKADYLNIGRIPGMNLLEMQAYKNEGVCLGKGMRIFYMCGERGVEELFEDEGEHIKIVLWTRFIYN